MEEALIKRVLPHSIEAEQSVIGSMLMDRDAVISASEIITGSDFYQRQYGIMFDAMVELFNEGKPVDLVTLQDRLKEKDVPPEVSSLDFVRDIVSIVPTSANVKSYAAIVREIWGETDCGSTKKLQVNMANIRKKLGVDYIETMRGAGYKIEKEN